MTTLGRLLRKARAGNHRSVLAGIGVPETIVVTSDAFDDGGSMPLKCAGRGVGDNQSPDLRWTGVPDGTAALVLIMEDDDVPLPRPLIHTIAILDPQRDHIDAGALQPTSADIRFLKTPLGRGYSGPPDTGPRLPPLPLPPVRAGQSGACHRRDQRATPARDPPLRDGSRHTDRGLRAALTAALGCASHMVRDAVIDTASHIGRVGHDVVPVVHVGHFDILPQRAERPEPLGVRPCLIA